MTALQAMILAIVQGITELFPISSLGHAVILPAVLGWKVDENAPGFLPFPHGGGRVLIAVCPTPARAPHTAPLAG